MFFQNKNVLVSGGAGFIGSTLVRELIKEKANVIVLDNFTSGDLVNLAEILLEKGYEVHGFIRRSATGNKKSIIHILDKITLHRGDLADA